MRSRVARAIAHRLHRAGQGDHADVPRDEDILVARELLDLGADLSGDRRGRKADRLPELSDCPTCLLGGLAGGPLCRSFRLALGHGRSSSRWELENVIMPSAKSARAAAQTFSTVCSPPI